MAKYNLSPVDNSTKHVYKMYKSKKNWVVAPVVLLTLLGAVAPAPIALSNVVNAVEDTATTTPSDSGNTKEEDTTVTADAATVAAKKDAKFAIENLELPKTLTSDYKNATFTFDGASVNYQTQQAYLDAVASDSTNTADAVFTVLKKAYSQAVDMVFAPFDGKADAQKAKLGDINGIGDSFDPGKKFLKQFEGEFDTTKVEVKKAYDKFVKELSVKPGEFDRTLGTESKPAENNYATVRKAFDDVLTAQTAKLSTIYDAAVEQGRVNTDYEAKKADAINRIIALPNLTVSEKNLFLANINTIAANNEKAPSNVDWRKDLDGVIATATNANNLRVSQLMTNVMNYLDGKAKDTTVDEKAIPIFLSSSEVAKYKNKVNEFGKLTDARDIPTNFNKVTDLQALFDQIKQANEEATIKFKLNELKQSYIAKINDKNDANYNLLKPEVRQGFVNRISSASVTTSAQVRDIFAKYEDELQIAILSQNSDLNTLKEKAYDEVNKDKLQNLNRLAIGNYQFAIKSASTKSCYFTCCTRSRC
nr:KxYKxGKxW signal peptide domain-containing protein [Enterococcus cecorum]